MTILGDYFSFSRGEKRGIAVLIVIIIVLAISNLFVRFFQTNQSTDFTEFKKAIAEFEKDRSSTIATKKDQPITYFKFNPNTISESSWKALGFKDWQIKAINKYKAKGGSWRTKQDVRKIYGLSDSSYALLEPFILLPEKTEPIPPIIKKEKDQKNYFSKPSIVLNININTADTSELKQLNGIGSVYAKRIIKYRDLLGGFINTTQLNEVYGLTKETYDRINSSITVGNVQINKLNINTSSAKDIQSHPYFDWNMANAIVNYRKTHGNYASISDVKKIHLITDEIYHKIAPYIKTE